MFAIVEGYAYLVKNGTGYKVTVDVDGNLNVSNENTISITNQTLYNYDDMYKKLNIDEQIYELQKTYIATNITSDELADFCDNVVVSVSETKYPKSSGKKIIKKSVKQIADRLDDCVITFDKNGGTGSMNEVRKEVGEKYNLPSCTFTAPADKQFKEWKIGETSYDVNDEITLSTSITVKAIWEDVPQEEHVHTLQFKEKQWLTGNADVCYIEVKHCSECGQDVEFPHEHNFVEDVDTGLMQCSECQQYQVDLS